MCTRKQPGPGPQRETDAKGNVHGCFGLQVKEAWKVYAKKHKFTGLYGQLLPNYHQGKL